MFKKIATGVSAFVLATTLASCSPSEPVEERDKVDVNGLTISAACEKVREAGWRVDEVKGTDNYTEKSDCSDNERKVAQATYRIDTVELYFANKPRNTTSTVDEVTSEAPPIIEEEAPIEQAPVDEVPVDEVSAVDSTSGYQAIYDEYSARIQNECPTLSIAECAELSNEGVSKMAEYMYKAKGTDGQYTTYETWAGKLTDVYMSSVL